MPPAPTCCQAARLRLSLRTCGCRADDPHLGQDVRAVVLVHECPAPAREGAVIARRARIRRADDGTTGRDFGQLRVREVTPGAATQGDLPGGALGVDRDLSAVAQGTRGLRELSRDRAKRAGVTVGSWPPRRPV